MRRNYLYTDNLREILSQVTPKEYLKVHEEIDYYIEEYNKMKKEKGGAATAYYCLTILQQLIDAGLETKAGQSVTCHKGCSFCCNIEVSITEDEAELLAMVVNNKNNFFMDC